MAAAHILECQIITSTDMLQYIEKWLSQEDSDNLFATSKGLQLEQRYANFSGKHIAMPRLTGWMNDFGISYYYSGQATLPIPWTTELIIIRDRLEQFLNKPLPSVLINYYRDRNDSVGWHKDNEKWFKSDPFIVSLTCGGTREFRMRNRATGESIVYELGHGDLLVFTDEHVLDWEHTIPKAGHDVAPRINFTFRAIKV
jgi:alkylated DNA repair dioxygenase AlkB